MSDETIMNEPLVAPEEGATTPETEVLSENTASVETTDITSASLSKADVIGRLKELVQSAEDVSKDELEQLKYAYYKSRHAEVAAARTAFVEAGGNPDEFRPEPDTDEGEFKAQMGLIKERRAKAYEEQERQKAENLAKKLDILERLKVLASTPEEANRSYETFKALQNEWKEIKNVPAENANELWKNYQLYVEQFYDLLKLNHEFREYDFKKNLEAKVRLCETAEKLTEDADPVSAFHQLQKLHQEYRETGPVAKELREEIWARFKAASTIINKRHQAHFEEIKAKEEKNLELKTALCEKIEAIETDVLRTFADWDKCTQQIIDIQNEWKTIGYTPKKVNAKIFERFRTACDNFFQKKSEYFKLLKNEQNANLQKKQALCEKAESLQNSTDWNNVGNMLIQLQKEWKTIGSIPKKTSETLWKRFNSACNYFFEQKEKATATQRNEETENLQKKKQVIEQLENLDAENDKEAAKTLRELMEQWNSIGFVPFKEKDKVYKAYHAVVDKLYKSLNLTAGKRRLESFKNSLKEDFEGNKLGRERERLFRAYEAKRNEIKTYENNLGFLSSSSKNGNSLVNEMKKKMERLKDDLELLRQKINAVDEEIKNNAE